MQEDISYNIKLPQKQEVLDTCSYIVYTLFI